MTTQIFSATFPAVPQTSLIERKFFNHFKYTILDQDSTYGVEDRILTNQDEGTGAITLLKGYWKITIDANIKFDGFVLSDASATFRFQAQIVLNGKKLEGLPENVHYFRGTLGENKPSSYMKEEFNILAKKDSNTLAITYKPEIYRAGSSYPDQRGLLFTNLRITGYKMLDLD